MNIAASFWPWIIGWVFGALLAGHIAYGKGRSQALYIFIGLFLTPIVALLMIVFSQQDDAELQKRELHSGRAKKCPACAEIVKKEATMCKHCGSSLS